MSQTPQKAGQKMCKSPKNSNFQKHDKIDYENLSTNCTVVGSNNLNLVKKPQIVTSMSPAYSNPSPGYPPSPYSSPASLKSPSPSLKPPTPQPNFPVMQIIHNNHILARPMQAAQPQNIIKLKPPLTILPKPAASPQPSPKPSVSPQIVIPTNQPQATIMPTAQPLLLNQMPVITTQFILRPQTATKMPTQMPTQMPTATPQGLILQSGGQPLLQIQPPRSQPMVRVLTNGMQLAPSTTTYVTPMANQQPINATHLAQQQQQPTIINNMHAAALKRKPKIKVKKKLDLANIMKLSGIGDEDDIQFESDTSQSESEHNSVPNTPQPQNMVQTSTHSNLMHTSDGKKIGNIQISALQQPTPVVQVLNQNFQSGMISNSTSQAQAGIPFNSFIAPNFTFNNGLMLQRSSGGFKLTVGEDGRLVLQHDPQINQQDLQSQLFLQSLLGLNTGLVLQPSMDQQTVQQTVQTIQQQSVQTIQQQTVQSQTIQTVQQQTVQPQHTLQSLQPQIQQQTVQQTIQHQTVQSQPLAALQQPMQIVQPQPIQQSMHTIQSQLQSSLQGQIQNLLQQQQQNHHPQPIQSFNHHQHTHHHHHQPVLKVQPFQKTQPPVQTVHPQPIQSIQQHPQHNDNQPQPQNTPPTSYVVNLTPEQLEQLKRNGQLTVNGQTIYMQRPKEEKKHSPKIRPVKKVNKIQSVKSFIHEDPVKISEPIKETKSSLITALQTPPKHILPQHNKQPSAMVQPSVVHKIEPQKSVAQPKPKLQTADSNGVAANPEVDKLLGQLMDENVAPAVVPQPQPPPPQQQQQQQPQQRITTIQLTPEKQQNLKNVQLQIQTLLASRQSSGDTTEINNALKLLFAEQQKILASGKLLPPDKVYYHNNQLTIVNPSSLNLPPPPQVKSEPMVVHSNNAASAVVSRSIGVEANACHQPITTQALSGPRVSVTVPSTEHATQTNVQTHPHPSISVINQRLNVQPPPQATQPPPPQPAIQQLHSQAKKAQLVETQLNLDQNGAVKPDIHTQFRDKKDACIRLIRYHCMDQPVLSQKDLHKADEIFELTARHFIGKYARMVDKYKYLKMKESMRHVQTSELMMLDRMFLAEEQQSLMQLRQDYETQLDLPMQLPDPAPPPGQAHYSTQQQQENAQQQQEDYDEWACIQRELGCLPPNEDNGHNVRQQSNSIGGGGGHHHQHYANVHPPKRSASTDSRLETLKRYRVDKHVKKGGHGQTDNVHNSVNSVNSSMGQNTHFIAQSRMSSAPNTPQSDNHSHNSIQNSSYSSHEENEPENNSIDEQVQSAIDSILNLQQNTGTALDLDSILS